MTRRRITWKKGRVSSRDELVESFRIFASIFFKDPGGFELIRTQPSDHVNLAGRFANNNIMN